MTSFGPMWKGMPGSPRPTAQATVASKTRWPLVLALLLAEGHAANILMATLAASPSHKNAFLALGHGLHKRGHHVTLISAFPSKEPDPRITEVVPPTVHTLVSAFLNRDFLGPRLKYEDPVGPFEVITFFYKICQRFVSDPVTQHLLAARPPVDLLILDGTQIQCSMGLVHHFQVSFLFMNPIPLNSLASQVAGNPCPYSVTPTELRGFTQRMNFIERFQNVFFKLAEHVGVIFISALIHPLLRETFGSEMPSVMQLASNVSFVLQVSDPVINFPQAYLPNTVDVGCLHCRPARPLPQNLETFVAEGDRAGFIFFSLGSVVQASNMPESLRLMFLQVFSQLPYRVLWKWEGGAGSMADLPPNVKLDAWMPQQDILGDSRLRVFLTHGGVSSVLEATYHGAPVVLLPVYDDQKGNALNMAAAGCGRVLEMRGITAQDILRAILDVAQDPRYRESALRRSVLLRDQPEPAGLRKAVYWTEYVIRHRGARHLQSPSKDLTFLQYYLLDVAAIYLALMALVVIAAVGGARALAFLSKPPAFKPSQVHKADQ